LNQDHSALSPAATRAPSTPTALAQTESDVTCVIPGISVSPPQAAMRGCSVDAHGAKHNELFE